MSEENVELVRRMLIEYNRTGELTEVWAPDFVWDISTYPGAASIEYRGREGFNRFLGEWLAAYEESEQELDDVLDAGGNQVVAVLHQRARPRGAEHWVDFRYSALCTLEGGLINRARFYPTADDALEAAGLRE